MLNYEINILLNSNEIQAGLIPRDAVMAEIIIKIDKYRKSENLQGP